MPLFDIIALQCLDTVLLADKVVKVQRLVLIIKWKESRRDKGVRVDCVIPME